MRRRRAAQNAASEQESFNVCFANFLLFFVCVEKIRMHHAARFIGVVLQDFIQIIG
jgi:hypothetical protein